MATECNTSILVPPLNIKNYLPDGWNTWFTQFKVNALVTKFPLLSDQEKVAVLLVKLGDEITPIFETFNVEVDKICYEELIKLFSSYFRPAKSRLVFFSSKQKPQESFDHFAQRLTVLSYPCCFGPLREGILRDVFLLNLDNAYKHIRDYILNHHRDPSFQEVLSFSKQLYLQECNVPGSVFGFDEVGSTVLRDPAHSRASDDTISCKRKEMDLDSSPESNSKDSASASNKFTFKVGHSTVTTPLQPNRDDPPNNFRPATRNDKEGCPLKLASAIKNALGSSSYSEEIPKLDFAFKCFSVNAANKPLDGNRELKFANSCSSESPLNLKFNHANFKSPSVSTRLSKFSNKSGHVEKSPTPVCEVKSSGDSLAVSHTPSNHNMNTWASKQEHSVAQVNLGEKDVSLGIKSGISVSQLMGGGHLLSDKPDDLVSHSKNSNRTPTRNIQLDPNPEPPVSKTRFSDVIIVFISEDDDIIHVCPVVKSPFLGTIENSLKKRYEQNDLKQIANITAGEKYAAPFKGDWYRAEIVSANMKTRSVRVSFCDYGNEEDICLSDLRLLPEEFQDLEPLSFPIRLPKGAPAVESGSKLKIRPLSMEDGWSWAVELRTSAQ